jgi:hypothetical protein
VEGSPERRIERSPAPLSKKAKERLSKSIYCYCFLFSWKT